MNAWPQRKARVLFALGCVLILPELALPCHAASRRRDSPLERMTPVPADETIPVIDFFRPQTLRNPRLNRAGTHFAALVSTPEDSWELASYDLEALKSTGSPVARGSTSTAITG